MITNNRLKTNLLSDVIVIRTWAGRIKNGCQIGPVILFNLLKRNNSFSFKDLLEISFKGLYVLEISLTLNIF